MPWPIPDIETPPEIPRPSLGRWLFIALGVTIVGGLMALLLWPQDHTAGTPWFWCCVLAFPLLAGILIFGLRWHFYEGQNEQRHLWLRERERALAGWDEWGCRHLVISKAAVVLPGNLSQIILTGCLPARDIPESKIVERPYNLGKPLNIELSLAAHSFEDRLVEIYCRLLEELAEALTGLESLTVILWGSFEADQKAAWDKAMSAISFPIAASVSFSRLTARPDFLEKWYDAPPAGPQLIVATALGTPECSEFAAAILFNSDLNKTKTDRTVSCFRPMTGPIEACFDDLSQMLKSGQARTKDIDRAWLFGMENRAAANLIGAMCRLEILLGGESMPGEMKLDVLIGPTGAGAYWLALALAAQDCDANGHFQLLATGGNDNFMQFVGPVNK